ncbi:MAG: hypothetical protein ACYSWO_09110 [Planctomycetota bacterium]|jgi:DNA-directed RNA polymerase subunit RPC12/RpoP
MFDPELQDMECPKCFQSKVYFDRKMGYYCMSCGHELSVENVLLLMEKMVPALGPAHVWAKAAAPTILEIRELPTRRSKSEHVSRSRDTQ